MTLAGWQVVEEGIQPLLDTGSRLVALCHPLQQVDGYLNRGGMPTSHGDAMPIDIFNFNLRPGEVHRRL